MSTSDTFEAAVSRHDAQIVALGLTIWVGSEPTFTDRSVQSPEWLNTALGADKEQRARAVLCSLCQRFPGGLVLRSVGRRYPGEELPRWNLGLYRRRDGVAFWHGPPDPILASPGPKPCLTWVPGPPPWRKNSRRETSRSRPLRRITRWSGAC